MFVSLKLSEERNADNCTNQITPTSVTAATSNNEVAPFISENDASKTIHIISWVLDEKFNNTMLNSSNMLTDGIVAASLSKLRENRNQSKLRRILEMNLSLIQTYISSQTYDLLLKIQKALEWGRSLKYGCMKCDVVFTNSDRAWQCERCLLWYHDSCMGMYPREPQRKHKYCLECYTE